MNFLLENLFFTFYLPGEEVDEPEREGARPHVAEVGQRVQEGHVGAADGGVGDSGKECHR